MQEAALPPRPEGRGFRAEDSMIPVKSCRICGKESDEKVLLEGPDGLYCASCFCDLAQGSVGKLTEGEKSRLKKAVSEEVGGLLPRREIRETLEEGYQAITSEPDFDRALDDLVTKIERVTGLAMFRFVLELIGEMQGTLAEQEEALREKLRKLVRP